MLQEEEEEAPLTPTDAGDASAGEEEEEEEERAGESNGIDDLSKRYGIGYVDLSVYK